MSFSARLLFYFGLVGITLVVPGFVWGLSLSDMAAQSKGGFPKTFADVSAHDRQEIQQEGYEIYNDFDPYSELQVQQMIEKLEAQREKDEKEMTHEQYCNKYVLPDDCNPTPEKKAEVIKIGDRPAEPQTQTTAPNTPVVSNPTTAQTVVPNTPVVSSPTFVDKSNLKKAHGGLCTPSDTDSHFINKQLTSGRYQSIDPAFEKALYQLFRVEGGCGDHPNDRGGYTCYGVDSRSHPKLNVKNITRNMAEDIYYESYYKKHGVNKLPDYIRGDVLRINMNTGSSHGAPMLCTALKIPSREKIDNEIIAAAENYPGDLHNDLLDVLQQYYIKLANQPPRRDKTTGRLVKYSVFLNGWMNSVRTMRQNGCHTVPKKPLKFDGYKYLDL